jgi:glycosyltransferase involved in cell wall biosynthesis
MNIGFDAKRVYQNTTGLGHYSRTLVRSLAKFFPEHQYLLFAPKTTDIFDTTDFSNIHTIIPSTFPSSILKAAWRSNWVKKDLIKNKVDIYHGLSHEIPYNIDKTKIKTVVTIHDLIFERYPKQYSKIDVEIYRKKFKYACANADRIIAISEQTKYDIINFYKINENKIDVCYQSCNDIFRQEVSDTEKKRVKELYGLPDKFFLTVGSIIERKNLLTIVKALHQLKNNIDIPLIVIGNGGAYKALVKEYIIKNNLQQDVIFLSDNDTINSIPSYKNSNDFPAIYQQATAMIYPSTFEGFGIPVLEALCSSLPVITSNVSCLPEAGGDAALLVDPLSVNEMVAAMQKVFTDSILVSSMKEKGILHAEKFSLLKTATAVMNVYKNYD